MLSDKEIDQIVERAGSWTPEETARVAGKLLASTSVDRNTVEVFRKELSKDDKDELMMQLESLDDEENS